MTAQDLLELGVVDEIVLEPLGGAHRDREKTIESLGDALEGRLKELLAVDGGTLHNRRREKFLNMGGQVLS